MGQYVQPVHGRRKDHALAASMPAPALASDGVSVLDWRPGATLAGYPAAAIAIFGDGAITLSDVKLYAYGPYGIDGADVWMFVANLNNGTAVTLTAAIGFVQQIQLPTAFERLAVSGTPSAGTVGYTATPLALHG